MMGKNSDKQYQFVFVNLEEFVPQDHLLRAILRLVNFNFVYERVEHLYSSVGRKSVDPVLLIKMLLLGYLYGIPSERKLEQEVRVNLAFRWFLGLDLNDPVPDHSTLSQNRRRRFRDSNVFQEVFDEIVSMCIKEGLVTGEVFVTDSTHIKANASNQKTERVRVEKTPSDYFLELENEVERLEQQLHEKRTAEGKKNVANLDNPLLVSWKKKKLSAVSPTQMQVL
jgi:transposase